MSTPRYATHADVVRAAGGQVNLTAITDFDNDGVEDIDVVNEAICEAEAFIDSYWRVKWEITPTTVPLTIRRIAAKLTVFNLRSDKDKGATITDFELDEHDKHIKYLEGIASGKIDPGTNPAPTASPRNAAEYTERPTTKKASRQKFKNGGFT